MATYVKTLYSVEITTKSGGTFTIADTATDATGSAVWGLVRDGKDVLYKSGETELQYIAHDCICSAKATITSTELEKPEDENCQPIETCPKDDEPAEPVEP